MHTALSAGHQTVRELVAVGEHQARILAATLRLASERVPLAEAVGRRLAEDVTACIDVPPWDNSAMDGYAVRYQDVASACPTAPVALTVVTDLPAGVALDPAIGPGQAARIMTGATLPSDADTVVRLEDTDRTEPLAPAPASVRVLRAPTPGMHVRRAGEDRRVGDVVAHRGVLARAVVLSAIASAGHCTVLVARTPRVAVVATGSELVPPGARLRRGQIPDANSLLVAGLVHDAGGRVVAAERVSDDPHALTRALARLAGCDAVILTGGVSAGAFDPVKQVFAGSSDVAFSTVAMQPGKPQAFGRLPGGALLFGLPGNPVSAWVSFHVFVRPALLRMQGADDRAVCPEPLRARVIEGWRTPTGRTQYLPAQIAAAPDGWVVRPVSAAGSAAHLVASLAAANGYAVVPAGHAAVHDGDLVDVLFTAPH